MQREVVCVCIELVSIAAHSNKMSVICDLWCSEEKKWNYVRSFDSLRSREVERNSFTVVLSHIVANIFGRRHNCWFLWNAFAIQLHIGMFLTLKSGEWRLNTLAETAVIIIANVNVIDERAQLDCCARCASSRLANADHLSSNASVTNARMR